MTADSPSLLLQRAADTLEQMGKDADGGPWRVDVLLRSCAVKTAEGSAWPGDHVANVGNRFSASWVATMSPVVSAPLVAWLRYAQAQYEVAERRVRAAVITVPLEVCMSDPDRAALDFARRVLGVSAAGSERSDPQHPLET